MMEDDEPKNSKWKLWVAIALVVVAFVGIERSLLRVGLFAPVEAGKTEAPIMPESSSEVSSPTPATAPAAAVAPVVKSEFPPAPQIDLEVVRANLEERQDYCKKVEAETLKAYDKLNPVSSPWYEAGRLAAQYFSLYAGSGDKHGFGLLQAAALTSARAYQAGCRDPLILGIWQVYNSRRNYYEVTLDHYKNLTGLLDQLAASSYPSVCQFVVADEAVFSTALLMKRRRDLWMEDLTPVVAGLPGLLQKILGVYEKMGTDASSRVMVGYAWDMVNAIGYDDAMLTAAAPLFDAVYQRLPDSGAARDLCQGNILISRAWAARGTGWAKTVTQEGWERMRERLAEAEDVLSKAEVKYPDNAMIPATLITVELGQGNGRDRMERFFERAIKNNPDSYWAYKNKMYYLQPRWYGTPQELFKFGIQSVQTGRWSAEIPMIFPDELAIMADQIKQIYDSEEVWLLVKGIFEEYLRHYPGSIARRTHYLKMAAMFHKWDVVREQFKVMGDSYDRIGLSDQHYQELHARAFDSAPAPAKEE